MSINQSQEVPMDVFALRPSKSAVVSEISEATASSPVPPDERVNFHIGNPVQDARLAEMYARIALDLPATEFSGADDLAASLGEELGWDTGERARLEFLLNIIRKSAPYLPRGGFLKNKPGELIRLFGEWVGKNQVEPLAYDFGEKSGRREVILATGGVMEALRVFLHALSRQLQHLPAFIHTHGIRLAPHLMHFDGLRVGELPDGEQEMLEVLRSDIPRAAGQPSFVLLGKVLREDVRRTLRTLAREYPLFIVEVNDAPNHASLAREARMMNRTLRFLTPGIFSPRFSALSTVFIAGYHEFISIIEMTHFQLKGTPSAAEVELLTYLLQRAPDAARPQVPELGTHREESALLPGVHAVAARVAARAAERVEVLAASAAARVESAVVPLIERSDALLGRSNLRGPAGALVSDPLEGLDFRGIVEAFSSLAGSSAGQRELSDAFKSAFLRHHPEYRFDASVVVSGSARTALGLLGFHCGIREVVIPDLSWTYEHCFPSVTSVPLTPSFELDVERMIEAVRSQAAARIPGGATTAPWCSTTRTTPRARSSVKRRCALCCATFWNGAFSSSTICPTRTSLLPGNSLGPMTLRQLTDELVRARVHLRRSRRIG